MNRRDFVTAGMMAGIGSVAARGMLQQASGNQAKFRMKYAPHFGMFKNSAGNDPIDQLKFAADQGFTAWEDNGMMRRDVELQKKNRPDHGAARYDDGRLRLLRRVRSR